jgi:DNA-binding NtrC family response regulator
VPHVRILVIDDDEEIREMLRATLEAAGYDVEVASDGRRGLETQRARPADLVITDIFMPEKEGIETIIELRQEFPSVRIIAMSGGGALRTLDYLPAAEQFGAITTFRKPFDPEAMLATVRRVLGT